MTGKGERGKVAVIETWVGQVGRAARADFVLRGLLAGQWCGLGD